MKNVKLVLAPLALLSCTLASCNSGVNVSYKPLNRLEYEEVSAETFQSKLNGIRKAQISGVDGSNIISTLPSGKGTVTLNYGLAAKGKLKFIMPEVSPIDLTNLNAVLGDTITISWNEDGYIKISDSRSTSHVIKKVREDGDHYYKCYDYDGHKYKVDITPLIFGNGGGWKNEGEETKINYFNNYIHVTIAQNLGFFSAVIKDDDSFNVNEDVTLDMKGVGFGLDGFGGYYNRDYDPKTGDTYKVQMQNYLAPGDWFTSKASRKIYQYLPFLKLVKGGFYRFASNDEKTASVNIAIKDLDLSVIPSIIQNIMPTAGKYRYEGTTSGTLSADYFVAYANNFINQHELIVSAKNAKANGYAYTKGKNPGEKKIAGYIDASLDASLYLGQQVELSVCEKDEINLDDYTDVDIPEKAIEVLPLE